MIASIDYAKLLKIFFQSRKETIFAYLFGSQAKNQSGPLSDIDLAVYFNQKFSASQRFGRRLQYIQDISSALKTDKIDLCILNDSPLPLRFSIVHGGVLVCDRHPPKRVEFEVKTMSLFFDRQYYEKRHAEFNLKRIAKEGIL